MMDNFVENSKNNFHPLHGICFWFQRYSKLNSDVCEKEGSHRCQGFQLSERPLIDPNLLRSARAMHSRFLRLITRWSTWRRRNWRCISKVNVKNFTDEMENSAGKVNNIAEINWLIMRAVEKTCTKLSTCNYASSISRCDCLGLFFLSKLDYSRFFYFPAIVCCAETTKFHRSIHTCLQSCRLYYPLHILMTDYGGDKA